MRQSRDSVTRDGEMRARPNHCALKIGTPIPGADSWAEWGMWGIGFRSSGEDASKSPIFAKIGKIELRRAIDTVSKTLKWAPAIAPSNIRN